jgi:7,8-dihydropterin-6-yl-methyl-4-(beta-D-ribofuranosyl)aminobenzene 5'-phosphate synthase
MRKSLVAAMAGAAVVGGAAAQTTLAYERNRRKADKLWEEFVAEPFEQPSAVAGLSVLPLIDYITADETLQGEPGVSYLVKAGDRTLLFDFGYNPKGASPSPLLHNMESLGVSRGEIDSAFISHRHIDHTGGMAAQKAKTFTITPDDPDPLDVPVYVPVEMTHPSAQVHVVAGPLEIAPGIYSIGPIARSLWLMGLTFEQALAVNVEGKGIVLIIGCGHQTRARALARTEALFDRPLYGVIGGLHFPVTASRMPRGAQRVLGTGYLPWRQIDEDDVRAAMQILEAKHPRLVAISPHDSCDWTLGAFRHTFGERYRDVVVGREIVV